jgi:hypothetical protein
VLRAILDLARRARWGKLAKRGGLAFVLAYATYLVGVNLALGHGLGLPEDVHVTYASAWSWYPGQVQARELRVIGTDSHVEWQLDIERVHFRLSLTDLLHRRFHASAVRASGVSMRMRRKLDPSAATPAAIAVLPPIAGITGLPLKPATRPLPIADRDYTLWSVQIDDADAVDVREVWFDAFRFTGEAHVTGEFTLRPVRMAKIGPAVVDVTRGELHLGAETALEGLAGHLEANFDAFDPRDVVGASFLRGLATTALGTGRVASVRFLNHYVADAGLVLDGGAGPVQVQVHVLRGVLAAPTAITLEAEQLHGVLGDHRASASARVAFAVAGTPDLPEGTLAVELTRVRVCEGRGHAPIARTARLLASGHSVELDLVHPFGDGTVSLEVPDAEVPDLRRLDAYFGRDSAAVLAGRAHVRGTLSASLVTRRATGRVGLTTDGLVVRAGGADVHLTALASVALDALDLDSFHADLSGSRVRLRDVVLSRAPMQTPWWSDFAFEETQLSLARPAGFRSKVSVRAKDGRPILAQAMPVWMANLIGLDGLRGGATVAASASRVDVTGLHVEGQGGGDVRGQLDMRGPNSHGVALARAGLLTVGVELNDGRTSLRPFASEDWFRRVSTLR